MRYVIRGKKPLSEGWKDCDLDKGTEACWLRLEVDGSRLRERESWKVRGAEKENVFQNS